MIRRWRGLFLGVSLFTGAACSTDGPFRPQSEYPPDPYVKGYSDPDDCLGGERLAARSLDLPEYPSRAYRTGRQGWVILRLDVAPDGTMANVDVERALPPGAFARAAVEAAETWRFDPPGEVGLNNCRVLIRFRLGKVSLGA